MATCPTCGRESDSDSDERMPVAESVTIFACGACRTGVIRTFAHHEKAENEAAAS